MHAFLRRSFDAAARRLRPLAHPQDGFTIVEVLVSAIMVILIAGGVMTGLEASGRATADIRDRSRANELAQQDQQRLQGMSAIQLQNLNQTRAVTFDGSSVPSCSGATTDCFTVNSTGQFLGSGSGTSCGSDQADYVKVVSTVDWGGNKRPPVVEQSIITPPIGGVILVRVPNELGASGGTPGATVNLDGPDKFTANTDSGGCVVIGGAALGDYNVTASKPGYVDPDGASSVSGAVTATASDTSTLNLKALGQAGKVTANFTTTIAGTTCASGCPNQLAPSVSWFNNGMAAAQSVNPSSPAASISTPQTLFPFTTGTPPPPDYTNNYAIYAGKCASDDPPTPAYATVGPGGSPTITVPEPGMVLNVSYKTATSTTRVTPSRIKLTDWCGQAWDAPVRTPAAPNSPLGQLQFPGQPWGGYGPCVEYNGYRARTLFLNQNFGVANTLNMTIDSTNLNNKKSCDAP